MGRHDVHKSGENGARYFMPTHVRYFHYFGCIMTDDIIRRPPRGHEAVKDQACILHLTSCILHLASYILHLVVLLFVDWYLVIIVVLPILVDWYLVNWYLVDWNLGICRLVDWYLVDYVGLPAPGDQH